MVGRSPRATGCVIVPTPAAVGRRASRDAARKVDELDRFIEKEELVTTPTHEDIRTELIAMFEEQQIPSGLAARSAWLRRRDREPRSPQIHCARVAADRSAPLSG